MNTRFELAGLAQLLETCKRVDVPIELSEPADTPLTEEELPNARPWDQSLSLLYGRVGGMTIGRSVGSFQLCQRDKTVNELAAANLRQLRGLPKPFDAVVAFAAQPATLYFFALVPWLAHAEGVQPVVFVSPYEEIYALPVASSLDSFFKTYARCLEFVISNPGFSATDAPDVNFWSLPEVVAGDRQLVEMLKGGRFDSLMRWDEEFQEWAERLKAAPERS